MTAVGVPAAERPLRTLWRYAARHRRRVWLATLCATLNKVADVVPELLIGAAVDVVVRGDGSLVADLVGVDGRFAQLGVLAAVNVAVWIAESGFEYAYKVLWRGLAQTIEHEARLDVYTHVQDLDAAYFEDTRSGGLLSVLNDDVNQLERFLDVGAPTIIRLFWNVVLMGAVFAASSWLLTLVSFAPIPVIVAGSVLYQRRLTPYYARVREQVGELSATLTANLGGITTIKAFTAEQREVERVAAVSEGYRQANREAIRYSSAFGPLIRMAVLTGFTATLLLGGWLTVQGRLEVGLYSVLVFMTQRLLWPLTDLGEVFDQYQRAMASVRRIFGLLALRPALVPGRGALPEPVRGEIRFEAVTFGYGDGPAVLSDVDIMVPAGEVHAVVGATGAGKSTVVKLLLRFHDVRSGRVCVDGVDVRELAYPSLRGAIGYVSQDVFLFHGTVADNIAYGRPGAGRDEVEEAARLAEADEFVRALPDGYDTVVGERGQKLSGGQRQRLSIARAILRDPAILLLDEATSAVDNETEAAIQRSLAHVTKGRTALVIAHRLSTVRDADRIWVLEGGGVAEAGTHDELVAAAGLYAALWRVQTGRAAA